MSQDRLRLAALVRSDFLPQLAALAESIPGLLRAAGYATRARNFGNYLRGVLLTSSQFQELASGRWLPDVI
jgi:hypothetical protein